MTELTGERAKRCTQCGDVLMYCSCVMDFIDSLPDRAVDDEKPGEA